MSAEPWQPDHLLTHDEWVAMTEDDRFHYELAQGVLEVNPKPAVAHQRAMIRLARQLDEQLPAKLVVVAEVDVVLAARSPATVRSPDLAVLPSAVADTNPAWCDAADVLLAVEIVSPDSDDRDHVTKYLEYSEAGIPDYWVLDIEERVTLTAYRLIDGEYELVGRSSELIEVSEPATLSIAVDSLLPRRS